MILVWWLVGTNTTHTFTITNTGSADLTITNITIDGANAASFTVTNLTATVSPGGSTNFTVNFAPTNTGVQIAALHIASNDPTNGLFNIVLTGTGTNAAVPVIGVQQPLGANLTNSVSTNDFGLVLVGINTTHTFTITNTGSADLTITNITIDGANAASFTVTNLTATLSPGGSTNFTVNFAPTNTGAQIATLHIVSNDNNNNPFSVTLTGTGVAPSIGVQQPLGVNLTNGVSTNNFGSVLVGNNTSLTFTITNNSTADLNITNITIDGLNRAMFNVTNLTATVSPGGSTNFTVNFAPTNTGAQIAALHIASNDPTNGLFNIVLTGTGTNAAAPLMVVQQPLGANLTNSVSTNDFGLVAVGTNTTHTFTITNTGSADLSVTNITIDGANAASFTVTNLTATLSPGGSTNFIVNFAPTNTGVQIATLHIASNDPTNGLFNIVLIGTGTNAAVPVIGVQQPLGANLTNSVSTNDFGSVVVGTNTTHTFTITNTGSADLNITNITIDGANAASFTVTNLTATLSPGGSTNFIVNFAPTNTGAQIAALHIASNDPTNGLFNIVLTGTGTNAAAPLMVVQQPAGTNLVNGRHKQFRLGGRRHEHQPHLHHHEHRIRRSQRHEHQH